MRTLSRKRLRQLFLPSIGWFYILYFALVMPFICWGAAAQPGHPHRLPHFVFAEPVTAIEGRAWTQVMHVHSHPVATDDAPVPHDVQQPRGHSTDAAGQATPAISAITLLTLVFLSSWQLQRLPQLSFPVELDNLSIRQFVPILRTPPPRPVLLVSALYR